MQWVYVVYDTKAFSETGGRLEVVKPVRETIRNDFQKQLVHVAQKRYQPIVLQ